MLMLLFFSTLAVGSAIGNKFATVCMSAGLFLRLIPTLGCWLKCVKLYEASVCIYVTERKRRRRSQLRLLKLLSHRQAIQVPSGGKVATVRWNPRHCELAGTHGERLQGGGAYSVHSKRLGIISCSAMELWDCISRCWEGRACLQQGEDVSLHETAVVTFFFTDSPSSFLFNVQVSNYDWAEPLDTVTAHLNTTYTSHGEHI